MYRSICSSCQHRDVPCIPSDTTSICLQPLFSKLHAGLFSNHTCPANVVVKGPMSKIYSSSWPFKDVLLWLVAWAYLSGPCSHAAVRGIASSGPGEQPHASTLVHRYSDEILAHGVVPSWEDLLKMAWPYYLFHSYRPLYSPSRHVK